MLRFVHSFGSKPSDNHNNLITLGNSALSVLLVKALGQQIVLHTDKAGKELLGHLPYDEIYLDLENHDCVANFGASGKIIAQQHEEPNTIHIDNDVFIWSKNIIDLCKCNVPIITYNIERLNKNAFCLKEIADFYFKHLKDHPIIGGDSFARGANCGVVKIRDKTFRDDYLNGYFEVYKAIVNTPEFKTYRGMAIDCLVEQLLLTHLADRYHYTVSNFSYGQHATLNPDLPIQHAMAYKYPVSKQAKEYCKEHFPEIYKDSKLISDELEKLIII